MSVKVIIYPYDVLKETFKSRYYDSTPRRLKAYLKKFLGCFSTVEDLKKKKIHFLEF